MKKAIITGATGFIGSHLLKELVVSGYDVTAIIRPNSINKERIVEFGINIIEIDLFDLESIESNISKDYEYFFHMAWEGVSGEKQSDIEIQMKNIKAAIYSVALAQKCGCKSYIAGGSIHEAECLQEMKEANEVTNMGNAYKIAKLSAHYYCKLKASALGIRFFWPRLTNAYGAGEHSARLINVAIRQLLKNESPSFTKADQLYDFIYITDAARAYRLIAEQGISFQNYIIGSGDIKPLKDYLSVMGQIVNPKVSLGYGKINSKAIYLKKEAISNENLVRDTGFKIEVDFNEGIKKTIDWIKKYEIEEK